MGGIHLFMGVPQEKEACAFRDGIIRSEIGRQRASFSMAWQLLP